MGQALATTRWTLAEFLAWEEQQPERHEYWQGEAFAMVGARRVHNIISGNLFAALKSHLRGTPCGVFIEGMKLEVADDAMFYPDVFVTCDPADLRTDTVFRAPTLVAEVLSPSTEAFDRGAKFAQYRLLPTLREYLLIDPGSRKVELFRRPDAQGLFTLHDFSGAQALSCASLGFEMTLEELFEGVEGPQGAVA